MISNRRFLVFLTLCFIQLNAFAISFPNGTVWFNTDYPLNGNMYNNKMVVVGCVHLEELTGIGAMLDLQDHFVGVPEVELLTLIPARDPAYSRQEIFDYIQRFAIHHPVAVVPSWEGIPIDTKSALPQLLFYNRNLAVPSNIITRFDQLPAFMASCDALIKENKGMYSLWQTTRTPEPKDWANPVVELPIDLTYYSGELLASEPGQYRVVSLAESGAVHHIVGGVRGFADGEESGAQMKFPYGSASSYGEGTLYIADTYNHSLRMYDANQAFLFTVVGNGQCPNLVEFASAKSAKDGIPYPTDVAVVKNDIYVLSGSDCSIWKVMLGDRSLKLVWRSNNKDAQGNAISALAMKYYNKHWYMLKSDGTLTQWKKKESPAYTPASNQERIGGFEFYNKDLVFSLPFKNQLIWKGAKEITAGSGILLSKDGAADTCAFIRPTSLNKIGNEIFVCEGGFGVIRKWKMVQNEVKSFYAKPTEASMTSGVSPNAGEAVAFESLLIDKGTTKVKFKITCDGYTLRNTEPNLFITDENSGITPVGETVKDNAVEFTIHPISGNESGFIQFALQLLLHPNDNPNITLEKKVFVVFNYELIPGSLPEQEMEYNVFVRPN